MNTPFVVGTDPTTGSKNVVRNLLYRIQFSKDINQDTLNESTVYVTKSNGNKVAIKRLEYQKKILTIHFDSSLLPSTTYYMHLSGGPDLEHSITDILGNKMTRPYQFVFSTEESDEFPQPKLISPSHQSVITKTPQLEWKCVQPSSFKIQVAATNTFDRIQWETLTPSTSVIPNTEFKAGNYYWRVRINEDAAPWSEVFSFAFMDHIEIEPIEIIDGNFPISETPNPSFSPYLVDIPQDSIQVSPSIEEMRIRIPGYYDKRNFDKSWINLEGRATGIDPASKSHGKVDFYLYFEYEEEDTILLLRHKQIPHGSTLEVQPAKSSVTVPINEIIAESTSPYEWEFPFQLTGDNHTIFLDELPSFNPSLSGFDLQTYVPLRYIPNYNPDTHGFEFEEFFGVVDNNWHELGVEVYVEVIFLGTTTTNKVYSPHPIHDGWGSNYEWESEFANGPVFADGPVTLEYSWTTLKPHGLYFSGSSVGTRNYKLVRHKKPVDRRKAPY